MVNVSNSTKDVFSTGNSGYLSSQSYTRHHKDLRKAPYEPPRATLQNIAF